MLHYCQLDYKDIQYGDSYISENGCAICSVAGITGLSIQDIISSWRDRYWDNDFGTIPLAIDMTYQDLGYRFVRADSNAVLQPGNNLILLTKIDDYYHYYCMSTRVDTVDIVDSLCRSVMHTSICSAYMAARGAVIIWRYCDNE